MQNLELQFRGNRFWEIIWKFPCPQKILMVTDSTLDFGKHPYERGSYRGHRAS